MKLLKLLPLAPLLCGLMVAQEPDNSKANKPPQPTAQDQSNVKSDVELTRMIRKAITDDKGLSTYAHNVKIITKGGMVNLRGPVNTDAEKSQLETIAKNIAGDTKVKSDLKVTASK